MVHGMISVQAAAALEAVAVAALAALAAEVLAAEVLAEAGNLMGKTITLTNLEPSATYMAVL